MISSLSESENAKAKPISSPSFPSAFGIKKSELIYIRLSSHQPSSTHFNKINSDESTTNINGRCKNFTKNVNKTVMKNLPKINFNRSRRKFSVAFQTFIWIIVFAVNITYSKAVPVFACTDKFKEIISNNRAQTKTTINNLSYNFDEYKRTTNTSDSYVDGLKYLAKRRSKTNIEDLFRKEPARDMLELNFKKFHDDLFDAAEHLKFFHCMHTRIHFKQQTFATMNLNDTTNEEIISYFDTIFKDINQNILQIEDALIRNWDSDLTFADIVENCHLHHTTSVRSEIVTMLRLNETLKFMARFFAYIDQTFC